MLNKKTIVLAGGIAVSAYIQLENSCTAAKLGVLSNTNKLTDVQKYYEHEIILSVKNSRISKRVLDISLSMFLLTLLFPLLFFIVVLVKIESPGSALFIQQRRGLNNRVFGVYKFRSMKTSLADHESAQQTARGDARLTRIGGFLRRHSLDELPQLLNVLAGDMSIVGPRPHALGTRVHGLLLKDALDTYVGRYRVKPGITGWAQVNGVRGEISSLEALERRIKFDLEYIERWSLLLDLKIIVRTLSCIASDENAY